MAVFIVLSTTETGSTKALPAASKDEVTEASSETHGKEQPTVEGHGNQHEEIAHTNLDHMKSRLQHMERVDVLLEHVPTNLSPSEIISANRLSKIFSKSFMNNH